MMIQQNDHRFATQMRLSVVSYSIPPCLLNPSSCSSSFFSFFRFLFLFFPRERSACLVCAVETYMRQGQGCRRFSYATDEKYQNYLVLQINSSACALCRKWESCLCVLRSCLQFPFFSLLLLLLLLWMSVV